MKELLLRREQYINRISRFKRNWYSI